MNLLHLLTEVYLSYRRGVAKLDRSLSERDSLETTPKSEHVLAGALRAPADELPCGQPANTPGESLDAYMHTGEMPNGCKRVDDLPLASAATPLREACDALVELLEQERDAKDSLVPETTDMHREQNG